MEGRSSTEGGRKEGGVWLAKLSTGLAEKLIVREGLLNPLVGADIVLGSREGKGRRWSSIVHIFKHGSYNFFLLTRGSASAHGETARAIWSTGAEIVARRTPFSGARGRVLDLRRGARPF